MNTVQEKEQFFKEFFKPGRLFRVLNPDLRNKLESGNIIFVTGEISYDERASKFKFHVVTKHETKTIDFHKESYWAGSIEEYFEEIK